MKSFSSLLLAALAFASPGLADANPQPVPTSGWQPVEQKDAARALSFTRFTLIGKFGTTPRDAAPNRPAMAVDCIPDKEAHFNRKFLAANLQVGTILKIVLVEPDEIHGVSYYPKVVVGFRADDAAEKREKWSAGTDKMSVSIPKEALKKILRARTLDITASDEHGALVAMHFDMPDPKAIEESCNVD
jgi:hypothetical protein